MTLKNNLHKVILFTLSAFAIVFGILTFMHPAAIFPDPSWGFQVMRAMENGAPFNTLVNPNPGNIAKNTSTFLTWWSPGQYFIPHLFKSAFNINTGQAAAITSALCTLLGLLGYYSFFRRIGFSKIISAASLAFIAIQQFFVVPFVFYNGGEVLLFGFTGWFLYGCTVIQKVDWRLTVFVLLAGWLGFLCKSSFIWMYLAGLCFIWIKLSLNSKQLNRWILNGLWIGIPALIAMGSIYLLFLSKGENPSSASGAAKLSLQAFCFPLGSPVLSGFSIDELLNGLIFSIDKPVVGHIGVILVLTLSALVSILLVYAIVTRIHNHDYKLMILTFYGFSVLFFTYAFLKGMNISYEARHFRIIGLIVAPGCIYLVSSSNLFFRWAFTLLCVGLAFLTISYFITGYSLNIKEGAQGISGVSQQFIDQESLDKIMQLDRQNRNATFVFVSPDLGLEIKNNRVITLQPIDATLRINMNNYLHKGHAGPLYIILPEEYEGPREKMIMKCFPGYKGFYGSMLSDDFVMWQAK